MANNLALAEAKAAGEGFVTFRWFGANTPLTLSLPEQIAARLGERIVAGSMAPGDRVGEQEVADEFQVSRAPVREALRILEREGLVTINPRRGGIVTKLSATEVSEIFEIRAALFRVVSQRLAETKSQEALTRMKTALGELERCAADPRSGNRYAEIVFQLGLDMAELSGNVALAKMVSSLAMRTLRYSRLGLGSQARRKQSLKLWRAEYHAIETGDVALAASTAVQRIEQSREEALRILRSEETPARKRGDH